MNIFFLTDIIALKGSSLNMIKHRHHAIQIVFSDEPLFVNGIDYGTALIIQSNAEHYIYSSASCISLLIDPQSLIGQYLSLKLNYNDILDYDHRLEVDLLDFADDKINIEEFKSLINEFKTSFFESNCLDERIQDVIEKINSSNGLGHTINDLAEVCYLSSTRFTHLFRNEVGLSVMRYIKWIKLISAARYIIYNDVNIKNVAYKFEFADESHFSRSFKNTFGINIKKVLENMNET